MITSQHAMPPAGLVDFDAVEKVLHRAAEAAASVTLRLFRTPLAVENKWQAGFDPVTEADKEAEIAIRQIIEESFPDHAIVGEEWANKETGSPFTWIIDPIDGTRAFISGVPVWGTLIGLIHQGRALAGLMAQPFTGETFWSLPGRARYRHGGDMAPLGTSAVTELAHAKLTTTSPDLFLGANREGPWRAISPRVLQVRYGLDCYGYCLLAMGQIDLVVEAGLKDVDIAPLIPIIENAGGVITTWAGGPAEAGGNCVAAATPDLHAAALAVLAGG
ncbi:histidinol-phosphatase [Devosia nitrariae]|uniref:Histidinol-phosphatase n=2 Tax=Devosia nitrariae TaxID=2071872 RepID=A0ABQ5WAQ0_9HYPH|nr:histidinol-phosphatase [Devosia nitrariae]